MAQVIVMSSQVPGSQSQSRCSEAIKIYLASPPSTTAERLIQGNVISDERIEDSMKQKEIQLQALVRQAMSKSSQSS
ncbi:hypothetical protein F4804DRAFT_330236 [Jackrogersella minutella]|nr:hypothetical protein F4804DRAFT_330236 [Jackrogersella minutella]